MQNLLKGRLQGKDDLQGVDPIGTHGLLLKNQCVYLYIKTNLGMTILLIKYYYHLFFKQHGKLITSQP